MEREPHFLRGFDEWSQVFADFVGAKGKTEPGRYRAYGYKPPGHKWADVKLYARDWAMRVGRPPAGSSPGEQHDLGLNKDERLDPRTAEGQKLRAD